MIRLWKYDPTLEICSDLGNLRREGFYSGVRSHQAGEIAFKKNNSSRDKMIVGHVKHERESCGLRAGFLSDGYYYGTRF